MCSQQGKLETPLPYIKPQLIVDNYEAWHDTPLMLFTENVRATIIRFGRYNVLINLEKLIQSSLTRGKYQLIHKSQGQAYHVIGEKIVEGNLLRTSLYTHYNIYNLRYVSCQEIGTYCFIYTQSNFKILSEPKVLLLLFLIIVGSFIFGAKVSLRNFYAQRSIIKRIQRGLVKDRFYPLFQPIVDMKTGKTIGVEILARFKDKYGEIFPDQFIPVISKLNMTWQFTEIITTKGYNKILRLSGNPKRHANFYMSLNLFPNDIGNGDVMKLENILMNKPDWLNVNLEITEQEYKDDTKSGHVLKELSRLGYAIAIDDFGTGYSNYTQLKNLTCNIIKIDKSYVDEMEYGALRASLLPHIKALADSLKLRIIVEGVEKKSQEAMLIGLGIVHAQGWLYSKALAIDKLIEYINSYVDLVEIETSED